MKTNFNKLIGSCMVFASICMLSALPNSAQAQVAINETFENSTSLPAGWLGTSWFIFTQSVSTTPNQLNCGGIRGTRGNRWVSSQTGSLAAPTFVSNGNDLSVSFDYKIVNFSSPSPATPNTPAWGNVRLQYSIDGGTTYTDYLTIDNTNHVESTACATVSATIPGTLLPTGNTIRVRWFSQWAAGDWYIYVDNAVLFQEATSPPQCNANLTAPANNATNVSITPLISWSPATGAPTGYNFTLTRITNGPVVIVNQTLGLVTSLNPGTLDFNSLYEVQIVPFNAFGNATGCTTFSFTTRPEPAPGVLCQVPIEVTSLPFTTTDNTVNYGNDYNSTNLPTAPVLFPALSTPQPGTTPTGSYLNGDDVVYAYTPNEDGGINITLSNHDTWVGLWVFTGCPFTQTVAYHHASTNTGRAINALPVVGGTTYYIVISTWPSPQTTAYVLNITDSSFDCPQLQANIGSPCNDNDPTTLLDTVQPDCTCAGQPLAANDLPCNAEPLTCGVSVSGNTTLATVDVAPFCGTSDGTSGGVWYLLNLDGGAQVTLTTCGSAFDTKLRVFSGACDALVCVTGNDDSQACVGLGQSGLLSQVQFNAQANTDYYILMHGFGTAAGAFTLNSVCVPFDCPNIGANIGQPCDDGNPGTFNDVVQTDCSCAGTPFDCQNLNANIGTPCDDGNPNTLNDTVQSDCTCSGQPLAANDLPCNAEAISCGASVSGNTALATADVLPFCGTSDGTGGGVWYLLNVPNSGTITLTTCGSAFDTKLRVFSGTCDALVCVGGNDDSQACVPLGQSALLSQVIFTAAPNTNYYILVHGFGIAQGAFTLNVSCELDADCPDLGLNIGDPCDDGNPNTGNDTVQADCTCAGTPLFDCPDLSANVGDPCTTTGGLPGTVDAACTCQFQCSLLSGGTVSTNSPRLNLCKGDGQPNFVQLTVTGNTGPGRFGIVRQSDLAIVAQNNTGLFNIETLPAGAYFGGYVSVQDLAQLSGVTNVNQLSGCFSLSNQLAITSIQLAGGTVSTTSPTTVCTGNVAVTVSGNQGPNSRFVLLNQTATQVIAINATGVFNFTNLANGIYRIVHISYANGVNLGAIVPPTLPPCVAQSNLLTITKVSCLSAQLGSSPNPTPGTSFVTFTVPTEEYTTLEVYDMSGRKIADLFNGVTVKDTEYRLEFNGASLPNGVYIYRLTSKDEVIVEKFMIAR
jgi:hypothetical protein